MPLIDEVPAWVGGPEAWCFPSANWNPKSYCCSTWALDPRPPPPPGCFDEEIITESWCCSAADASDVVDGDMPPLYRLIWTRQPPPVIYTLAAQGWQLPAEVPSAPLGSEARALAQVDALFENRAIFCSVRVLGTQVLQPPSELLRLTNLIHRVRPTTIVETGTYRGGMALFLALALDAAGVDNGKVFTIDMAPLNVSLSDPTLCPECPECLDPQSSSTWLHRVKAFQGDSEKASSSGMRQLLQAVRTHQSVNASAFQHRSIVILDAGHSVTSVVAEFNILQTLMQPGSYFVIQDTQLDRVYARAGPRAAAMLLLLQSNMGFVWDRSEDGSPHAPMLHHMYLRRVFSQKDFHKFQSATLQGMPPETSAALDEASAWISRRYHECDNGC